MPKIKLKPNLQGVEIGIGNLVNLKVEPGEVLEVAEDLLGTLLSFEHFELAVDVKKSEPSNQSVALAADPSAGTEES